ncbi:MAG: pentapeptide repeat-containing protein [Marinobacterium sp.]|nr:pentapeptide repeat-containing protein [Marinobacterium sp.]
MIRLNNADMRQSDFDDVNFAETRFSNINLGHAQFSNVNMSHVVMENMYLVGAEIRNPKSIEGMTIDGVSVKDMLALWHAHHTDVNAEDTAS